MAQAQVPYLLIAGFEEGCKDIAVVGECSLYGLNYVLDSTEASAADRLGLRRL